MTPAPDIVIIGPGLADLVRGAVLYLEQDPQGAKPRDLPVEQPAHYEIYVNFKTAKALGLTIPPSLLQRADQVIE